MSLPLDSAASIPALRALLAAGVITPDECARYETKVRQHLPWMLWLQRGLLALGIALIVCGVGYFFAHHLESLTNNDKLGLAAGAVFLALSGGAWAGFDRFSGKLLLLAASALAGVYLGVFGQIYETGAETYEFFAAWVLLILPWVVLSRFVPLWLFLLYLLNFLIGLWCSVRFSYLMLDESHLFHQTLLCLILLNLGALILREYVGRLRLSWLDQGWSALVILLSTLALVTLEVLSRIVEDWDRNVLHPWGVFFGYAIFSGLIGCYYYRVRASLPALALLTLSGCLILTFEAVRGTSRRLGDDMTVGHYLVTGFLILAIFGGGVFLLRVAARRLAT